MICIVSTTILIIVNTQYTFLIFIISKFCFHYENNIPLDFYLQLRLHNLKPLTVLLTVSAKLVLLS